MRSRISDRGRRRQILELKAHEQGTRRRLFEAAGRVFAERGYDRATGKEICSLAGTNTAAVNYHFGGMEALYAEVVAEAYRRLIRLDALSAAVAGQTHPAAKLRAGIELIARTLTVQGSGSWELRVIGREIVSPSPVVDSVRDREIFPKTRILASIVSELMGLPQDHPAVARGCMSVAGPIVMLLVMDRSSMRRLFPKLAFGRDQLERLVDHLVQFALAGLESVAATANE
ncbi:MAG: CerR family C-terminal domain-containing protein [Phycisphaerae bacterium]|nr:CerR family C-terminal domain-containing protein [Phycisphaerae bacterium]